MTAITVKQWIKDTYTAVAGAGLQCAREANIDGWQENHITTQLLSAIGMEGDVTWSGYERRVKWRTYKLSGSAETQFGDIALIVKVQLADKICLTGATFYEAKKQYFSSAGKPLGFKALDVGQLSTIVRNSPASHVLLYDSELARNRFWAMAVPTQFVQSLGQVPGNYGRDLLRYGLGWVHTVGRNFLGLDLDYRTEAVNAAGGFNDRQPSFVINVAVSLLPTIEPTLGDFFVNAERYELLGTADEAVDAGVGPTPRGPH